MQLPLSAGLMTTSLHSCLFFLVLCVQAERGCLRCVCIVLGCLWIGLLCSLLGVGF